MTSFEMSSVYSICGQGNLLTSTLQSNLASASAVLGHIQACTWFCVSAGCASQDQVCLLSCSCSMFSLQWYPSAAVLTKVDGEPAVSGHERCEH